MGHFGISVRIALGRIQLMRSTQRRTNDAVCFVFIIASCGRYFMRRARTGWLVIASGRFYRSAFAVHVSRPRPIRKAMIRTVLLAALGRRIEKSVDAEKLFAAATKVE